MGEFRKHGFERLEVYNNALHLSVDIRKAVASFPATERYATTSQIIRASDSIRANLAEGSGRASNIDQAHFTNMAYSSALEVIDDLNLALLMEYINQETYNDLRTKIETVLRQLNSLYRYQINNKQTLKKKQVKKKTNNED